MVGLLCGVGCSGCCGRGVGSSGSGLPLLANLLLLALEQVLETCPPGRVGCFGLIQGAGPFVAATLGGDVGTNVLDEGCGLAHLWLVSVMFWVGGG